MPAQKQLLGAHRGSIVAQSLPAFNQWESYTKGHCAAASGDALSGALPFWSPAISLQERVHAWEGETGRMGPMAQTLWDRFYFLFFPEQKGPRVP